ncbi:MAG TPA: class I SAM-dependent methyltransferase [Streptosporangiaceae bacterium]|nr:class I SAM-dependent methyltransferase [Streptosporangiaceae bacterium]
MSRTHSHHHGVANHGVANHGFGDDAEDHAVLAEMLDLDAQVITGYLGDVTTSVFDRAADRPIGRILDLGAGTGNGALALAARFGAAEVIAVDQSAEMLARLEAKAVESGLADRVRTVAADLDTAWPAVGAVDLVWTSMALHHLADPDAALRQIFAAIRAGGLLAVAEMTAPVSFLPDVIGIGRPGLAARCQDAFSGHAAAAMPHLGSDWGPRLAQAGFTSVERQDYRIELDGPLPAAAGRYAQLSLRHAMTHLDSLSADDLATLKVLTDDEGPDSVLRRQDLVIRGARTLWTAERP